MQCSIPSIIRRCILGRVGQGGLVRRVGRVGLLDRWRGAGGRMGCIGSNGGLRSAALEREGREGRKEVRLIVTDPDPPGPPDPPDLPGPLGLHRFSMTMSPLKVRIIRVA